MDDQRDEVMGARLLAAMDAAGARGEPDFAALYSRPAAARAARASAPAKAARLLLPLAAAAALVVLALPRGAAGGSPASGALFPNEVSRFVSDVMTITDEAELPELSHFVDDLWIQANT